MNRTVNGTKPSDQIENQLVATCNEIHSTLNDSTLNHSSTVPIHHDQSGPLRWRESCDKVIAVARDVLHFRVIMELEQIADESDAVRATLTRVFPKNLTFDQIQSVFIDGKPVAPTCHAVNRMMELDFHEIRSGSIVVATYRVRVNFNAETTKVFVGDTRVAWSWIESGESRVVTTPRFEATRIPAPHRSVALKV
jgi:hypothetical protein